MDIWIWSEYTAELLRRPKGWQAELYALGDGAADLIYLGDEIYLKFGNSTSHEAWEGQIGYGPTRNLALGGLGAGGWTSGSRHL